MTWSMLWCCTSIIRSSALVRASSSLSMVHTRAWPRTSLSTKIYFRSHFRGLFLRRYREEHTLVRRHSWGPSNNGGLRMVNCESQFKTPPRSPEDRHIYCILLIRIALCHVSENLPLWCLFWRYYEHLCQNCSDVVTVLLIFAKYSSLYLHISVVECWGLKRLQASVRTIWLKEPPPRGRSSSLYIESHTKGTVNYFFLTCMRGWLLGCQFNIRGFPLGKVFAPQTVV